MIKGLNYYGQINKKLESTTILQRIAGGDELAVNECVQTYGNLVWSLAKRNTKTREDAEDLVQEIFIDIWKCAARFDAAKSPEHAFIILITKRRLIDDLRKSYRQPRTFFFENELKNQSSEDHNKLQIFVEMKPLFEAMNKLSFHEKQLIQMSVYDGASHSEIAQMLELPIGTVKSRIRRGLHKIRNSVGMPLT